MPPLSKKNIREIEDIFTRKLEPFAKATQLKFQKMDERFSSLTKYFQLEFQGLDQKIENGINQLNQRFDQAFSKLDKLISMYKDNKQEIAMFLQNYWPSYPMATQSRHLNDRVDKLETKR